MVSEPLFQSSSQKTTLAQGVVSVGVFQSADISFECECFEHFAVHFYFAIFFSPWVVKHLSHTCRNWKLTPEVRSLSNQIFKAILFQDTVFPRINAPPRMNAPSKKARKSLLLKIKFIRDQVLTAYIISHKIKTNVL